MASVRLMTLALAAAVALPSQSATEAVPATAAGDSVADSALTSERLTHYLAVKQALGSYWNAHRELLQAARSTAHQRIVALSGERLPVGVFDYPTLVAHDSVLAAIFAAHQLAPVEFEPIQVAVYTALARLTYHAALGAALPDSATLAGRNLVLASANLQALADAGVVAPPTPAGACSQASSTTAAEAAMPSAPAPAVPDLTDDVTVVPFYQKPNETSLERTKVVVPAAIDGHHGIFILDLGDEPTALNRTFLQPNPAGGVDTVTHATQTDDHTPRTNYINHTLLGQLDRAHVTVRIGTLVSRFQDRGLTRALHEPDPTRYNVVLGHLWGNFGWVFGPRLGNIGPAVLEPFETIIDYTHRRVVLIRLDSAGRRLATVPGYTPRWHAPLLAVPMGIPGLAALGLAVSPCENLDTDEPLNNVRIMILDTGAPSNSDGILGYPFLRRLGVFGINQRTHQFILYR